jgi:hypothetical protein
MTENILNMFCSKCNQKFAINLSKCPDCGESVTEEVKESLIYWASFGIAIGVASIFLAVSTSFPNSPVHRVYQVILIVMGPLLIFSGLRQFLSSRGKILRRGLGSFLCITGLGLFIFAGWIADVYFRSITWSEEGFMMLLALVFLGMGLWQFTKLEENGQNTSKSAEISL